MGRPATPITVATTCGDLIRAARLDRFLTQEQLADAIADASAGGVVVTRAAISRWESGERLPAKRYMPLLAEVLDISPATFRRFMSQAAEEQAA